MDNNYHPTLWRTCRVLANENRLKCLREVIQNPGSCVEDIAVAVSCPANFTSMQLRALQARGLMTAYRQSRWVRYTPKADPHVPSATPILNVFIEIFQTDHDLTEIIKELTAYTHPRRLQIIKTLHQHKSLDSVSLAAMCSISLPAVVRHIRKLNKRYLIDCADDKITLLPGPTPLHRTLQKLIITDE